MHFLCLYGWETTYLLTIVKKKTNQNQKLLPWEMDSWAEFTCFSILIHKCVSKSQLPKRRKKALSQTFHRACQNAKKPEISWYFTVMTAGVSSCQVPCIVKQTRELSRVFSLLSGAQMDFLSIIFWLRDGGSEISLEVFMQSTETVRGTAEKFWQALTQSLWLVGVKQLKQGPQSLAIGVPSGDIWVWKFFAYMICQHHMREFSSALGAALEGLCFQVSICITCFISVLCVCPEFLHLLCEGPHGGDDIILMTMKGGEIKYTWGTGQRYKLKPEWNKPAEFHSIYVEYELRAVDSAQWHE